MLLIFVFVGVAGSGLGDRVRVKKPSSQWTYSTVTLHVLSKAVLLFTAPPCIAHESHLLGERYLLLRDTA